MKFPPSTITPPSDVACPSIYFVVECKTIFAPSSNGLQRYGVANVLSTTNGISAFFATPDTFSKSRTSRAGFPIVSPYISFVLSSTSANMLCALSEGDEFLRRHYLEI